MNRYALTPAGTAAVAAQIAAHRALYAQLRMQRPFRLALDPSRKVVSIAAVRKNVLLLSGGAA